MLFNINILIDDYADMDLRSRAMLNGIHENAVEKKIPIRTFFSFPDMVKDMGKSKHRYVIIIAESKTRAENLLLLCNRNNIHPIFINMQFLDTTNNFSNVNPNYYSALYRISSIIISENREPSVFIGYNKDSMSDINRLHGFKKASEENQIPFNIVPNNGDINKCIEDTILIIGNYKNIICTNDTMALLLMTRMKELGIPPEKFNIIGSGNMKAGEFFSPSLTTIAVDYFKAGIMAVDVYIFLMKRNNIKNTSVSINCKIIIRESARIKNLDYKSNNNNQHTAEFVDFYNDEQVHKLTMLERMLSSCDETDLDILNGLLMNETYEQIAEKNYVSVNTIKYRLRKIETNLAVKGKPEIVGYLKTYCLDLQKPGNKNITIDI